MDYEVICVDDLLAISQLKRSKTRTDPKGKFESKDPRRQVEKEKEKRQIERTQI